ncbi:MAG: hypothetical protein Q8O76_08665 [Chloroflexota bacterium]|nr:hypothetical protein [Chloroflexota bacterium]
MAGRKTEYEGTAAMNSLNYFGFPIAAAGLVAPEGDGYQVLAQRQGRIYRKLVFKDGSVVGLIFMGKVEGSGIIYGLMKDKVQVGDFKDALWQDDLGLIALPEELRRERLARAGGKG